MAKKYDTTARGIRRKLQQLEKYVAQLNTLDVPIGVAYGCRKTGGIMVFGDTRITDVIQKHSDEIISCLNVKKA